MVDTHPEFAGLKNARWADPSADHAARQLQEIADNPQKTAEKAANARDFLLRYLAEHTYEKALKQLADRKP